MTIDELEDKHFDISVDERVDNTSLWLKHYNISIQFAIEMLEEILEKGDITGLEYQIDCKIEELKECL